MNRSGIANDADLRDIVVEPLGEFAYLIRNLPEPWRYSVDHPAVTELVPARSDLGIYLDPQVVTPSVAEILGHLTLRTEARDSVSSPVIEIPVLYDGEDLAELEMTVGPSVVDLHTKGEYQVQFIGFMPGFPYLSGLPDVLRGIPRRSSPRTRVPAGSVAIAEEYCGIYPAESPGGWWLLGRTPLSVCDPVSDYFLLKPGDRVQFRSITEQEFEDFP